MQAGQMHERQQIAPPLHPFVGGTMSERCHDIAERGPVGEQRVALKHETDYR
jgi:hypothetical protein